MLTPKREKEAEGKRKTYLKKRVQKTQFEEKSHKLEKSHRGRLEKKMLGTMIKCLEKVKGKMRSGKFKNQGTKN